MTLWERLFADPVRPILLRVLRDAPSATREVQVDAVWYPSRERTSRTFHASSEMVLVPWRGESSRVELEVRVGDRVGQVTRTRRENRDAEVVDVALERARASA